MDLVLAAVAVGVALSAKHSGIITLVAVGVIGLAMAIIFAKNATIGRVLKRSAAVAAVSARRNCRALEFLRISFSRDAWDIGRHVQ
jgi:hypothetical protein